MYCMESVWLSLIEGKERYLAVDPVTNLSQKMVTTTPFNNIIWKSIRKL